MRRLDPREKNWLLAHGWTSDQLVALEVGNDQTPVEYLTGRAVFLDFELTVSPAVLIPRLETEELVALVVATITENHFDWVNEGMIVEVGTGSGAIAIGLARQLAARRLRPSLVALDISAAALAVATSNVESANLTEQIDLRQSDLLTGLAASELRSPWVLVANLPYIPTATYQTLAPSVRDFEPRLALDGGEDGLMIINRLLAQVAALPTQPVAIFLEVDPSHQPAAITSPSAYHWQRVRDQYGRWRFWVGRQS